MADFTITLTLNDEQRALLEQARGDRDISNYALEVLLQAVQHDALQSPVPLAAEITTADHIRLAQHTRVHGIDVDEFERRAWSALERDRALHPSGTVE